VYLIIFFKVSLICVHVMSSYSPIKVLSYVSFKGLVQNPIITHIMKIHALPFKSLGLERFFLFFNEIN